MYVLVLLQTLLERELRREMARSNVPSLPLYPDGRACTRPTTPRMIELVEPIQRHAVLRCCVPRTPATPKVASPVS